MNTTLSTTPGRHDHPPHQPIEYPAHEARHVGLLDRLALHLGVALIKWGRRPHSVESREQRARSNEQEFARVERESAAERSKLLGAPRR